MTTTAPGATRPAPLPGFLTSIPSGLTSSGGVSPADLTRLREPFAPDDIEWRVQSSGEKNGKPWARVLAYITNRAIMDRLDDVAGPANWQNAYREGPTGGVICGLSILCARTDGAAEWITKWDGAENTDIESVKGGLSNSMKRAAVQWGLGRYLYNLEEGWATVHDGGRFSARTKDGKWFKWDPPALPNWAVPTVAGIRDEQHDRIVNLCRELEAKGANGKRVAAGVMKRLDAGLSAAAAEDAIRFLEARLADESAAAA